jgi:hypothetical protein
VNTKSSYKIRQKSTGLYSTGGYWPKFTKNGKTWSGSGPLKNHLKLTQEPYSGSRKNPYTPVEDFEIVELVVVNTEVQINRMDLKL